MNRQTAGVLIGAIVLVTLVLVILLLNAQAPESVTDGAEGALERSPLAIGGEDAGIVPIYFPDSGGRLTAEEREIEPWESPEEGAIRLLEALLAGPVDETLSSPLPLEVSLGPVHLSPKAALYVDLLSTVLTQPPPTGSQMELLSVYSLIDTVLLNIPEIDSVVLLWNGRQLATFAGHVDTSMPLRADPDLVRRRR